MLSETLGSSLMVCLRTFPRDPAPPWGPLLLHDYKPFQSNFPGQLFTLQPLSSASPAELEYLNFLAPWLRQLLPPRGLWVRLWGQVGQRRTRGRGLALGCTLAVGAPTGSRRGAWVLKDTTPVLLPCWAPHCVARCVCLGGSLFPQRFIQTTLLARPTTRWIGTVGNKLVDHTCYGVS